MNFPSLLLLCYSLICCSDISECRSDVGKGALGTFAVERIIEKIQAKMRFGFPIIGISPLSPLKLSDRNNTINLSFMQFNSTLSQNLIDGMDRFRINYVKFSLRDKSMNFSLTFTDLKSNGSYDGTGNFIKYVPISGKGNYDFDVYNLTTNVISYITFKRFRMQITNLTATSTVNRFKSNVTGLIGNNRWMTKTINRLLNRLIEVATPRIFDLNQRLFNYAISNIVVPRINKILTMYSVITPSTKLSGGTKKSDTVFLRELSDATIIKYLRENPIHYPDEQRILNMLFDDKFYDKNVRRKRDALGVCCSYN